MRTTNRAGDRWLSRAACHAIRVPRRRSSVRLLLVGNQIWAECLEVRKLKLAVAGFMEHRLFLLTFSSGWRYCCRLWGEDQWQHTID